jgi:hypothetical protein
MKYYFQHQTGNIAFNIAINATNTTSKKLQINLGQEGIEDKNISFIIESGNLYDKNEIFFGGFYTQNEFELTGSIYKDFYNYYYNNLLIRSNAKYNCDFNYIEVLKDNYSNDYIIESQINGEIKETNKNLLYITTGINDSGIINIISGMNIFKGEPGIITGYNNYTGFLNSGSIEQLNYFDAIVFGQYINPEHFIDKSGWYEINKPIIFLGAEVCNFNNLDLISGEYYSNDRYNGNSIENNISQSYLRRVDYNQYGKIYLFNIIEENFIYYLDDYNLVLSDDNEFSFISIKEQNKKRIIFNTPINKNNSLFNMTSDNWKKILTSCLYDLIYINTDI